MCAIKLGMAVPCHHCTDTLRPLDSSAMNVMLEMTGLGCAIPLDWARGCGRDFEENSCGSAITLGMTVPCHHCTDMLRFMDSPVTVVKGAAIGEGIRSSVAAGSG
ncbi:hypothetical protein CSKR_103121 [Clonorchis sinensis]|uniref:Uncharacterized protein n=1 Tax=Clonorchis sinensis TaxID=79923 RepID=A0A3R7H334_CLOSI|nr:hypothetical protein CSKR_103121 [Clonorchis sinensis]